MHYKIKNSHYVRSIIISIICITVCHVSVASSIKLCICKKRDLLIFKIENMTDNQIEFENISYRNKTNFQGKIKYLESDFYLLNSDTIEFNYNKPTKSNLVKMQNSDSIESFFRWETDSIKEKSVKAFFVRIPYKVIKKINFVEFTYYENGFQKKIYTPIKY